MPVSASAAKETLVKHESIQAQFRPRNIRLDHNSAAPGVLSRFRESVTQRGGRVNLPDPARSHVVHRLDYPWRGKGRIVNGVVFFEDEEGRRGDISLPKALTHPSLIRGVQGSSYGMPGRPRRSASHATAAREIGTRGKDPVEGTGPLKLPGRGEECLSLLQVDREEPVTERRAGRVPVSIRSCDTPSLFFRNPDGGDLHDPGSQDENAFVRHHPFPVVARLDWPENRQYASKVSPRPKRTLIARTAPMTSEDRLFPITGKRSGWCPVTTTLRTENPKSRRILRAHRGSQMV
jgi:hypothetical protein